MQIQRFFIYRRWSWFVSIASADGCFSNSANWVIWSIILYKKKVWDQIYLFLRKNTFKKQANLAEVAAVAVDDDGVVAEWGCIYNTKSKQMLSNKNRKKQTVMIGGTLIVFRF